MATALSTWTIDPGRSSVEFSLDYIGFSTYRTGFRALEGSLPFDADRPDAPLSAAFLPSNARSRRVAERGGARAAGQMHVVGLEWDRWVWPLAPGASAQPRQTGERCRIYP